MIGVETMVRLFQSMQLVMGEKRSVLSIRSKEINGRNSRMKQGHRTHQTRFIGQIDRTTVEEMRFFLLRDDVIRTEIVPMEERFFAEQIDGDECGVF